MTELAKRAVACKGWLWLPGMRWITLRQAPLDDITGRISDLPRTMYAGWMPWPKALPDLNDDLTRLGLLALVREAWGGPMLTHYWDPDIASQGSWCMPDGDGGLWLGDTEAEALVAALEAAP